MLALMIVFGATTANAQDLLNWDENGQCRFYAEDLECEGSVVWDEDEAAFHFLGGTTPGRIYLRPTAYTEQRTIDFTEVARIETFGPAGKEDRWGEDDPIGGFYFHDAVNGFINQWAGSRYELDYSNFAKNSAKLDTICFTSRPVKDADGNVITDKDGNVTYKEGYVTIDEIVLTKSVEQDPMAITADFWYEWDNYDATAQHVAEDKHGANIGCGVLLNTTLSAAAPCAGLTTGSVSGVIFADLTPYAGIYIKGGAGTPWRGIFNRQAMGDSGADDYANVVVNLNDDGEYYLIFEEDPIFLDAFTQAGLDPSYVHLNTAKINWGAPDGAKITKFNFIEKVDAINNVSADATKAAKVVYNLAGQKVANNYKGIVIKNGNKILKK